jgi:hypothetical protein
LIVGEFSAALDQQSFPRGCDDTEKDRHRRVFLQAQLNLFEEFCAGWYFWTLKKGNGWDAGWSAKDAATAEILPGWVGGKVQKPHANDDEKESRLQEAMSKSLWVGYPSAVSSSAYRFPYRLLELSTGSEGTRQIFGRLAHGLGRCIDVFRPSIRTSKGNKRYRV